LPAKAAFWEQMAAIFDDLMATTSAARRQEGRYERAAGRDWDLAQAEAGQASSEAYVAGVQ
jgi:hypothetical protein